MSDRIHVATLYRSFSAAGDENRFVHLVRALDRRRFEHVLVIVMPPEDDGGPMLRECRRLGVEIVYLEDRPDRWEARARGPRALVDASRIIGRLVRLLVDRRIDVLDVRLAAAIPLGVLAGEAAGTPAIVGTQYYFEGWDTPRRRALANLVWPRLDALVCDSRYYLDDLRRFLLRPPPGVVIPNGVFAPASDRASAEMRSALGLPASPAVRVIGQLARFVPWKGQRVLLEAARRVLSAEPEVAFLLCGLPIDVGFREELARAAADLGDRVRVVSYPGPAADVWRVIDIHAHAALYDSSPIAIHEGMALRKPAVVTAVGGIPELVEHERTGLLVPPEDPDALAAALLRLLRNPDQAARFGAAARFRYARDHLPERMARRTEALFEALVKRGRRRRRRAVVGAGRPAAGPREPDPPRGPLSVTIGATFDYPVIIERGSLAVVPARIKELAPGARVVVLDDARVHELYGERFVAALGGLGIPASSVTVPDEEASKSLDGARAVIERLHASGFERRSVLVNLGGGLVTDLGGFVASVYMRGVPYVNVPTTLLAQHDSAIGGKVAVNVAWAKNFIGAFHHPRAVYCDPAVLATQSQRDISAGIAEAIKVAVIADPALFELLEASEALVRARDVGALEAIVRRAAAAKIALLAPDPWETDLARALNLGHTFGHSLEVELGYAHLAHGEAVAFGVVVATALARGRGVIGARDAERIVGLLDAYGLPPPVLRSRLDGACRRLSEIRLVRGGQLHFVLPERVGAVRIVPEIGDAEIAAAIRAIGLHPRLRRAVVDG